MTTTHILLKPDDVVRATDEWWCDDALTWRPAKISVGSQPGDYPVLRRAVTPADTLVPILGALAPFAEMADEFARFPSSVTDAALKTVAFRFNNLSVTRGEVYKLGRLFDQLSVVEKPKSPWIPVGEKQPAMVEDVLVCTEDGDVIMAFHEGGGWFHVHSGNPLKSPATHWMPVPEAPVPF